MTAGEYMKFIIPVVILFIEGVYRTHHIDKSVSDIPVILKPQDVIKCMLFMLYNIKFCKVYEN